MTSSSISAVFYSFSWGIRSHKYVCRMRRHLDNVHNLLSRVPQSAEICLHHIVAEVVELGLFQSGMVK